MAEVPFGGGERQIVVLALKGGAPKRVCAYAAAAMMSAAWARDGRSLIFTQATGESDDAVTEVWQVSAEGGQPRKLGISLPLVRGLAVHPDGQRLAYIGGTRETQEVWLLENFLPPAKPSATKPPAAKASVPPKK